MRRMVGRIAGWSVLGAALLALIWGLAGLPFLRGGSSGSQNVETGILDVLPGLAEAALNFGSPLEDQVAEAPPFGDAFEIDARRLAWTGPGEIVSAQFPNVPLPGGVEPDFGDASEPPAGDALLAAFGENADGIAGLFPDGLGSFLGPGSSHGPPPGGWQGGNPNGPLPLPRGGEPVPEPSPMDLLQIALALLAGLAYRRFRA